MDMSMLAAKQGDSIILDMSPDQVKRYAECKLVVSISNESVEGDVELELIDQSKLITLETLEPREELTPTILARKKVFRYMFRTLGVYFLQLQYKEPEESPALFARILKTLTSYRKRGTEWKFTKPFMIEVELPNLS
jgi:hypothetical protein